jgi:hypothetical protein
LIAEALAITDGLHGTAMQDLACYYGTGQQRDSSATDHQMEAGLRPLESDVISEGCKDLFL